MTEPLTAAQIIKMIHPDLPPATAHFLLNEAKPLLEWIEAQAREIERYRAEAYKLGRNDGLEEAAQLGRIGDRVKNSTVVEFVGEIYELKDNTP